MKEEYKLSHLKELEAESIHIIREVAAEFENPVMLYSIGKDSSVMVRLAEKAFAPGKVPFPLMHIDSKWKFKEMIQFRDEYAKKYGWNLIVESNMEAFNAGVGPFTHGSKVHTDLMKTQALLHALDKYKFDAAFGGARRDEEKSRAKERIFSFRDKFHQWDPKNQRPELWDIYNARVHKGESIRVFPLSNWTELDIWQYIRLENIPIVPLYFAKERPCVEIDGAEVKEIKRSGQSIVGNLENEYLREGDTLVVMADDSFVKTWGESSVFVLLANGKDTEPVPGKGKRWFALALLILMIVGATVGELPVVKEAFPEIKLDMFFFVSITTIIMAWTKIFPARKYTKYISWDILITIACAFAISKAMVNSGVADAVARFIIGMSHHYGPHVLLAAVFIITNLFTELITNNAAAALAFPLALSISSQMGVSPMPFFVVICMAASASFSTPIGYQTNLIVQGIGNYKFTDFVRIGLPLNIITFLISIFLIPLIWPF